MKAGTREIEIERVELLNNDNLHQEEYEIANPIKIRIHYLVHQPVTNPVFNITVQILNSYQVTGFRTDVDGCHTGKITENGFIDIDIPNINLLPNVYALDAVIFHQDGFTFYDRINRIAYLKVSGGLNINGSTYIPHEWNLNEKNSNFSIVYRYICHQKNLFLSSAFKDLEQRFSLQCFLLTAR